MKKGLNKEGLEVTGRTVEEAVEHALEQLNLTRDQVEVTILKKEKSGIFGLGVEEARVKVRPLATPFKKTDEVKIATEVVLKLLNAIGVSAKVHVMEVAGDGAGIHLDIRDKDLGILIGRRGQTLVSLQYIVRLIVSQRTGRWVPLTLDVAGYKKHRYQVLHSLAQRLAEQVGRSQKPISLEPMPADERRIIHLALANHPDVVTQSVGIGEARKVTILPKRSGSSYVPTHK